MNTRPDAPYMWDAFVSYAQTPDQRLAKLLRDRLQSFGKAAFALRRARVFLDQSSLAASADLPRSLRDALVSSRTLVVLCCPEAARSTWVTREISSWLEHHPAKNVLLVLTAGRLAWHHGDFDPHESDALPAVLRGQFKSEPLWVDLRWARAHPDPRHSPEFNAAVARLAAAVLGIPLDEIEGDDVRGQRLLKRLRLAAIAGLTLLTALAIALAISAESNRRVAERQGLIARQRALAMSARAAVAGEPSLANAERAAAHVAAVEPSARSAEAWEAAIAASQWLPTAVVRHDAGIASGAFEPTGSRFAVASARAVSMHDATGRRTWSVTLPHEVGMVAWTSSGRRLLAVHAGSVTVLREDGTVEREIEWAARDAVRTTTSARAIYTVDDRAMVVTGDEFVYVDVAAAKVRTIRAKADRITRCGGAFSWSRSDGAVFVHKIAEASAPPVLRRHRRPVTLLTCAADGSAVVSVDDDDNIVWSRAGRSSHSRVRSVRGVALNPGGDRLAVIAGPLAQSGRLNLRGPRQEVLLFADRVTTPVARYPTALFSSAIAFAGDDLLVANDRSTLIRIDARRLTRIESVATSDQIDHIIPLATSGDALVVTKDGKVQEVDFVAGARRPAGRTTGWATKSVLNADRRSVLLFSRLEGSQAEDQREAAVLVATERGPGPAYFEPGVPVAGRRDGSTLMSLRFRRNGSTDVVITRLPGLGGESVLRVPGHYESIEVSKDGSHLLLWGDNALLARLDQSAPKHWVASADSEPTFVGRGNAVLLASESPELFSAIDGSRTRLPFETSRPGTVQVTSDLRFAKVIADDRHQLWDLRARRVVYEAVANSSWSAGFSADESMFVAAVQKGGLDVLRLDNPTAVRHVDVSLAIDGDIAFNDSGSTVWVPARAAVARVDLSSGAVRRIDGPGPAHIHVAPRERGLVVAYPDDSVAVLDANGQQVARLRLSATLGDVAFAANGSIVALGSHDGGVRLVEMETGRLLADVRAETGSVVALTFVAADTWLLIDGTTRAAMIPMSPYTLLCARSVRSLSQEEWTAVGGNGAPPSQCR